MEKIDRPKHYTSNKKWEQINIQQTCVCARTHTHSTTNSYSQLSYGFWLPVQVNEEHSVTLSFWEFNSISFCFAIESIELIETGVVWMMMMVGKLIYWHHIHIDYIWWYYRNKKLSYQNGFRQISLFDSSHITNVALFRAVSGWQARWPSYWNSKTNCRRHKCRKLEKQLNKAHFLFTFTKLDFFLAYYR